MGVLTENSDTLKRHQKLHVADGNKSMQRGAKSSKRARVNTSVDASQSDRYTGSYIDQCPPQEISEPQFCYDTLEAWDYSSFDPMFTNDGVPFMKINEAGNWFNASYIPFEESCIGSFGSEFTMDPEFPWEQVEGTRPLNAICWVIDDVKMKALIECFDHR